MSSSLAKGVIVSQSLPQLSENLLSSGLCELLSRLHRTFEPQRRSLLRARESQQEKYNRGETPHYIAHHPAHSTDWKVNPIPHDLLDRRVEITGPINSAKMVINMLNPGPDGIAANTAMLDFEDSMRPTWENVLNGLHNILAVAKNNLSYQQPASGLAGIKTYSLQKQNTALPMVRVRGLHLDESNFLVDGQSISAGLFDLTCTAFLTARLFLERGITPKFYVPKCEHYLEARWWNLLFQEVESALFLEPGTIRVTFLIETLPACFQMEEILYEIRERACGLNCGRWDKIFSDIKTLGFHKSRILADRSFIDMSRPWMQNYAKRLIHVCHKHGAFAMGGMSAFTPGKDTHTREIQTQKVIADKKRESELGHDGCWVSHPYFILKAQQQFPIPNQLHRSDNYDSHPDLLPTSEGPKTIEGLRTNIRVAIAYQAGWNEGLGCVSFENLMEDLATLEISRAQVWQWLFHQIQLDDGTPVTVELIQKIFTEETHKILSRLELESVDVEDYQETKDKYIRARDQALKVFLAKELEPFFNTPKKNQQSKERPHVFESI